jgi:iron complex outermembrane receptor protein
MSHRREKRARRVSRTANAALMTAVSLEALCIAAPRFAQAQSAPTAATSQENLEEIIITGYRASLESALNNKRNSDLPIESIAPEDIGKIIMWPRHCSVCPACRSIARTVKAPRC